LEKLLDIVERQEAKVAMSMANMETDIQDKLESDIPLSFASEEVVKESDDKLRQDTDEVTLGDNEISGADFSRFLHKSPEPTVEPLKPNRPEENEDTDLYSLRNFNL